MRLLILCVAISAAVIAWSAFKQRPPMPDMAALQQQHLAMEVKLDKIKRQSTAPPVHQYWEKIQQYLSLFNDIQFQHVSPEKPLKYPHHAWAGTLTGPLLSVLRAVQKIQRLAPVYAERLVIRNQRAELLLHVWGGP